MVGNKLDFFLTCPFLSEKLGYCRLHKRRINLRQRLCEMEFELDILNFVKMVVITEYAH